MFLFAILYYSFSIIFGICNFIILTLLLFYNWVYYNIIYNNGVKILHNKLALTSFLIDTATNTPVSVFSLRSNVLDTTAQLIEAVAQSGIITDIDTKETLHKIARGLQIISSIYSRDFLTRFFTNILIPSILKSSGGNGDTEKFQLSESLSLNVTPGVFKTSEGTVKITLASSWDLSNDVYCMIASGDSGRFSKIPASAGSRRVFTTEFNAGELFASMDAEMIDIMCVSCVSDDEGICGMLMSNTAVVDWLKGDNTPPVILTNTLDKSITGQPYSLQLTATGTDTITWISRKDSFPTRLTLSTSGLIPGTPKKAGNFTFTVTAKNKYGTYSKKYTVKVIDPVSITTASLKAGTIDKSYTVTIKAKGTKTITWSATGLPASLTINAKTGKISGKPTVYGDFSVKITAENEAGSVTRTLALTVKAVAPMLSGSLKQSTFNVAYSSCLKVKGSEPITWSIDGTLPDSLTFDTSTRVISGTPTSYGKNGNFKIKITASNPVGSRSKSITFRVKGTKPTIKSKFPNATAGKYYSVNLTATGSDPITWTADLPEYLTLDGDTIAGNIPDSVPGNRIKIKVYASNPVKTVNNTYTIKVITNKKAIPENLNDDNDTGSTENESDNETPTDNNAGEVQGVTGVTGDSPQENQKSGVPESYIVVAELGEISRDVTGMYDFEVELPDPVSAGSELIYIANSERPSDDDEIAEFFDDTGKEITAVPESRKISVSVWLNPHRIYSPVISVRIR